MSGATFDAAAPASSRPPPPTLREETEPIHDPPGESKAVRPTWDKTCSFAQRVDCHYVCGDAGLRHCSCTDRTPTGVVADCLSMEETPDVRAVIIIPTECNHYSDWMSITLVSSLNQLRERFPRTQQFKIARLVSCTVPESPMMTQIADISHVSPLMSPYPGPINTGYAYPPLNKPHAVVDWIINGTGQDIPDDWETVIVDPDFLFTEPIPLMITDPKRPWSATYSVGMHWLFREDPEVKEYCNGECDYLSRRDAELAFDSGAPYAMQMGDLRRLAPWWLNHTERATQEGDKSKAWGVPGGWISEMYAYIMAAMREHLPHSLLKGLMVSMADSSEWSEYIRPALGGNSCALLDGTPTPQGGKLINAAAVFCKGRNPMIIHYCQPYNIAKTHGDQYAYDFYKHEYHNHDWRSNGVLALNCSEEVANSIFERAGPVKLPEHMTPNNPPTLQPIMVGERWPTPEEKEEAIRLRTEFFVWHMYYDIKRALTDWRERFCNGDPTSTVGLPVQ